MIVLHWPPVSGHPPFLCGHSSPPYTQLKDACNNMTPERTGHFTMTSSRRREPLAGHLYRHHIYSLGHEIYFKVAIYIYLTVTWPVCFVLLLLPSLFRTFLRSAQWEWRRIDFPIACEWRQKDLWRRKQRWLKIVVCRERENRHWKEWQTWLERCRPDWDTRVAQITSPKSTQRELNEGWVR